MRRTGKKLKIDEYKSVEVEYNVDLPLASSVRYPAAHLQFAPGRSPSAGC